MTLPSNISTPNDPSSSRSTPSLKVNDSRSRRARTAKRPPPLPRKTSNTKRKRTRGRKADRSSSDSENFSDQEEDESGDEEEEEAALKPSPSKRLKGKMATAGARVATAPSLMRTLRPRATKIAAQLAEERQTEAAFRSALAR